MPDNPFDEQSEPDTDTDTDTDFTTDPDTNTDAELNTDVDNDDDVLLGNDPDDEDAPDNGTNTGGEVVNEVVRLEQHPEDDPNTDATTVGEARASVTRGSPGDEGVIPGIPTDPHDPEPEAAILNDDSITVGPEDDATKGPFREVYEPSDD